MLSEFSLYIRIQHADMDQDAETHSIYLPCLTLKVNLDVQVGNNMVTLVVMTTGDTKIYQLV